MCWQLHVHCTNFRLCNDRNVADVPTSMVNVEVWIDLETSKVAEDWVKTGYVERAGQLGPLARYDWLTLYVCPCLIILWLSVMVWYD